MWLILSGWGYHRRCRLSSRKNMSFTKCCLKCECESISICNSHSIIVNISEKTKCLLLRIYCTRFPLKKRGGTSWRDLSSILTVTSWMSSAPAATGSPLSSATPRLLASAPDAPLSCASPLVAGPGEILLSEGWRIEMLTLSYLQAHRGLQLQKEAALRNWWRECERKLKTGCSFYCSSHKTCHTLWIKRINKMWFP